MIVPVVFVERSTVPAETRLLLPAKTRTSLTMYLKPLVGSFRDSESARALVGVLDIFYCLGSKEEEERVYYIRSWISMPEYKT